MIERVAVKVELMNISFHGDRRHSFRLKYAMCIYVGCDVPELLVIKDTTQVDAIRINMGREMFVF